MPATTQAPRGTADEPDDPEVPGTYVTDGERLFRLVAAGEPGRGFVGLEDCASLDVVLVRGEELRGWDLDVVSKPGCRGERACR